MRNKLVLTRKLCNFNDIAFRYYEDVVLTRNDVILMKKDVILTTYLVITRKDAILMRKYFVLMKKDIILISLLQEKWLFIAITSRYYKKRCLFN